MNPRNWADRLGAAMKIIGGTTEELLWKQDFEKLMDKINNGEIQKPVQMPPEMSAFGQFEDQAENAPMSSTDLLTYGDTVGRQLDEIGSAYREPPSSATESVYDANKPMDKPVNEDRESAIVGAAQESLAPKEPSAFQGNSMGGGLPEMQPAQDPMAQRMGGSAFDQGQVNAPKTKAPIVLYGQELAEIGVPPQKIQSMMQNLMQVATMVMKAPKSMRGNMAPFLNVLEMQQRWLTDNYNRESQVAKLIYDKNNKAAEKADDREYNEKVKFPHEIEVARIRGEESRKTKSAPAGKAPTTKVEDENKKRQQYTREVDSATKQLATFDKTTQILDEEGYSQAKERLRKAQEKLDALDTGMPTEKGRVKVRKDGKTFTLPASQLEDAKKQGYEEVK
jgi:hypothetical protein